MATLDPRDRPSSSTGREVSMDLSRRRLSRVSETRGSASLSSVAICGGWAAEDQP